jgi:chromosome segregation ATPase
MSEQQIKQIMAALEEQNKALDAIREEQKKAKERIESVELKLEPLHEVFNSVTGFSWVSISILKTLILIGAGVGVIWGCIQYLKR